MAVHAIIFDRDNTLVYFEPQAIAYQRAAIGALEPHLQFDDVLHHWQHWPGPWPQHPTDETLFWQTFWHTLFASRGLTPADPAALAALSDTYYTCFAPFPEANSCLTSLRAQGLQLALLTNFELPSVDRTLIHAGIDPSLFAALHSRASLGGLQKPDPRAFQAVADELGEPLSACALIDDQWEHVAAARALGMRGFWLDRSRTDHDLAADVIASLEPLPYLFASACGSYTGSPSELDGQRV